jgi:SpoVK/Ycf46/Vps4 family AAA+-type ATPase
LEIFSLLYTSTLIALWIYARINSIDSHYEVLTNELAVIYEKTMPQVEPENLPNGIYTHEFANNSSPERLSPMNLRSDNYLNLLESLNDLDETVDQFINNKDIYDETLTCYKLGILLFGPPGTGKTSYLREFIRKKTDSIVIFMSGVPSRKFLEKLENSTKNRLKILVFEEALSMLQDSDDIREMLDFLDGSMSVSNSIYFLSTNYPEDIPENVIRNGRVDVFVRVEFPDRKAREKLISLYLKRQASEEELNQTENIPIVDIREMCFLHRKNGKTFKECAKIVEDKNKLLKKYFGKSREIKLT